MRRLLLLAAAIVFVDTVFYAAITPLLPRYSAEFALSTTEAGVLAAAYAAGTLVGALPGGWLVARAGVRFTVLVGLGLMAVASVAFAFAPSIELLNAARFVQGLGGAASWTGAFGWLVGAAPRERRGEVIGAVMAAAVGGALFGPALGAAAAAASPEAVFSGVGLVAIGLMGGALRTPAAPPAGRTGLAEMARALGDGRIVANCWLILLPGLMFGVLEVLVPLRLDVLGAEATAIAAVFLLSAALEALVMPLVGRLSDRRGRALPRLAGLGASAAAAVLLPWPDSAWLLAVVVVLAGPALGVLYTPAMALLSDGAEALGIEQGLGFALMSLFWSGGQLAGAAGGARLADATSGEVPYLVLGAVFIATFAVLAGRLRERLASPTA
jgi:MFS family permease